MWLWILVTALLVVGISAAYLFSSIFSKWFRFIALPIIIGVAVVIILIPNSTFSAINVPIFNNTVAGIVEEFLHTTPDFTNLVEYDPNVSAQVIDIATSIVKACVASVFLGVAFILTTIVGYVVRMCKANKKVVFASLELIAVVLMSSLFIVSPIATVVSINNSLNAAVAKDNETLVESYPEFSKFELMFKIVEMGGFLTQNETVENVLLSPVMTLSFADLNELKSDLAKVDELMVAFKESGLTILYTNKDFDFSTTVVGTFNFEVLKGLIANTLETSMFNDLARSFTNDILGHFETILQPPSNVEGDIEKPTLKLSKEEFKSQYAQIMDLMELVVKYDLVEHATNMDTDSVIELINKMDPTEFIDLLVAIRDNPIVTKIDTYLNTDNELTAGIYTCIRLYDSMNSWLDAFRTTDFYKTAEVFLTNQGVL